MVNILSKKHMVNILSKKQTVLDTIGSFSILGIQILFSPKILSLTGSFISLQTNIVLCRDISRDKDHNGRICLSHLDLFPTVTPVSA